MSGFKDPDYLERKNAGNDARKAALEQYRARLAANDRPATAAAAKPAATPGKAAVKAAPEGKAPKSKASKPAPESKDATGGKRKGK